MLFLCYTKNGSEHMKKLKILYEDKNLLVVDKESGLLTISTPKEKNRTLFHEASDYVKKQYPKNKVFIVHRLDKDTSGIVVFAKNQETKNKLQNTWEKTKRGYLAIVEGHLSPKKDTLKSYLVETKSLDVYSTKDPKKGKIAITEYEVINSNKNYSLLKINIKTGRRNQIRVQLSDIKHPIIGDKKYHSKTNPINRLGLHANYLEFTLDNKTYTFTTDYPTYFTKIFPNML